MYILLLVILNSSGSSVTTTSIKFNSETNCLMAINEILKLEDRNKLRVQARCLKEWVIYWTPKFLISLPA